MTWLLAVEALLLFIQLQSLAGPRTTTSTTITASTATTPTSAAASYCAELWLWLTFHSVLLAFHRRTTVGGAVDADRCTAAVATSPSISASRGCTTSTSI